MAMEMNGSYCVPVLCPVLAMCLCLPCTRFLSLLLFLFCYLGLLLSFWFSFSWSRDWYIREYFLTKKPLFKPLNSTDLVLWILFSSLLQERNKIGLWVWFPWCIAPWSYICSSLSSPSLLTGSCHIRRWIGGSSLPPNAFPLSFSV